MNAIDEWTRIQPKAISLISHELEAMIRDDVEGQQIPSRFYVRDLSKHIRSLIVSAIVNDQCLDVRLQADGLGDVPTLRGFINIAGAWVPSIVAFKKVER